MPHSRAVRALRGFSAAAVATFVALLSHVAGGGDVPGLLGILVPLVLATTVCTLLAGRRLSLVRLAISVAVSQLLFHSLFVLGASDQPTLTTTGHHAGSMLSMSAETSTHLHTMPSMWVGHVVAAVVTTLAIFFAERMIYAVLEIARRLRAWASRLVSVVVLAVATRRRPAAAWFAISRLPWGVFPSSLSRRGPPSVLFA